MTVSELMQILSILDPEAKLNLAMQPSYPLAHRLQGVHVSEEDGSVWLVEGGQKENPYDLPEDVFEDVIW